MTRTRKKQKARRALWAPVAVAVSTGLRLGEILALKWSDVDLKKGTLIVRHTLEEVGTTLNLKAPKTKGSRRTVPLHPDTVQILKEHRRRQNALRLRLGWRWEDQDLVFPDTTPTSNYVVAEPKDFPAGPARAHRRPCSTSFVVR